MKKICFGLQAFFDPSKNLRQLRDVVLFVCAFALTVILL